MALSVTNLVGFGGKRAAAAGATSPTYRTSAETATTTITIPASVAVGDFAIFVEAARNTTGAPSGWTLIERSGDTYLTDFVVSYRKIQEGDASSSVTLSGSPVIGGLMLVFDASGNGTFTVTEDNTPAYSDADPADVSTTTANSGTTPLIVFGIVACSSGTTNLDTESPAFSTAGDEGGVVTHTGGGIEVGYSIYGSSPANHTVGQGDNGTHNYVNAFYVEFGA